MLKPRERQSESGRKLDFSVRTTNKSVNDFLEPYFEQEFEGSASIYQKIIFSNDRCQPIFFASP